jgi:ATP-binding cassette subfamily B protein
VALARTFFRDAPLAILDEPTAALDAKAEHELFARIGELFADRSVLLISHRFSTVRSADRIYVLNDGRLVESGTHDELIAAAGTYAELFSLQASPYQPTIVSPLKGSP